MMGRWAGEGWGMAMWSTGAEDEGINGSITNRKVMVRVMVRVRVRVG